MTPGAIAAVCLAGLLLAGCSTASNTLSVSNAPRRTVDAGWSEQVLIDNAALGRALKYGDVVARKEGLILRAQVAIENASSSVVSFEYRWEWTDADGFQVGDTLSTWQPALVNGGERKLLSGVGPGPTA
ncbi:MAG: YcfL family protein, partial [bacterium]